VLDDVEHQQAAFCVAQGLRRPASFLLGRRARVCQPDDPCQLGLAILGHPSENRDLPAFVVLVSVGTGLPNDQPLYDRLWGSGFLPSRYQGIRFRSGGDPVLYLSNPDGLGEGTRRRIAVAAKYASDFGIAAECGFGRRPPETIPNLLRVHSEV